ncbi:MAG: 50S ribosomal protein L4 [Candidatus Thorarchaeota archaeon]|nr:MAG: 50S ribosomal protein L4 [Candidatus Thorarchaeota archaeon]RLI60172.1 MAG: 50S ribosomal protein L4 [Candidatus Thorarchaeota archaeon]
MTTVKAFSLRGKPIKERVELPAHFDTPYRPDVIKRAVLAVQSRRRQPHGVDEMAGKRNTAESWQTGHGRSRIPRVKGSGTGAANKGAFAPGTVGGRVAHPPEARKVLIERINNKEKRLAIRSAIAATANERIVRKRGHKIDNVPQIPLIVSDKIQSLTTTKEVYQVLAALGLEDDLLRAKNGRSIRSGKGKMRGRKMKTPKSLLIVVGEDSGIGTAARNLPGVDVVEVHALNAELLAPGTHAGRLVAWTRSAVSRLEKEGLFT